MARCLIVLLLTVAAVIFGHTLLALGQGPAAGPRLPSANGAAPPAGMPGADSSSPMPGEDVVVDVRVVGNKTLPLRKISPLIRTRKGRPFDSELIEDDVRRMTRSGYFADVRPFYRRVDGGRVVIFEVVERPRVQYIKFVGAEEVAKKVLRKEIDLKVDDALDPYMVAEARNRIEALYHKRGFDKVQVTVVEGSKLDDQGVVFLINEGAKKRILWTNFVGNTIASDSRLRTQIKSNPGFFWFFGGEVNREKIDADVDRLVAYYRGLGFLRARVGRELSHDLGRNWLTLTFVIDEGPRFEVRDVKVVGNKVIPTEELTEELRLQSEQNFNDLAMKSDVKTIEEKYGSIGYVFANVKPNIRYLENEPRVDLIYEIEEGDRYRVGRINVEINGEYPHTKITTVLNRLSFKPGDIVDIRELRASETRLRRSELFLVDPMSGKVPKIVFSPPELDESRGMLARQPDRDDDRGGSDDQGRYDGRYGPPGSPGPPGSSYRGQSPDGATRAGEADAEPRRWTVWSPPKTHRYAEPYVDLTIRADGTAGVSVPNGAAAPEGIAPGSTRRLPPSDRYRSAAGVSPVAGSAGASPSQVVFPRAAPSQGTSSRRPTVVRYQSPTRSTPSLPSRWDEFNGGTSPSAVPYPSSTQPATTQNSPARPPTAAGGYPAQSYPSGSAPAGMYPSDSSAARGYPAASAQQQGQFQQGYRQPGYPTAGNVAPMVPAPTGPMPGGPAPITPNPAVGNQYPPDPIQSGGQGMFAPPQGEVVPEMGPVFGEYPGVMGNALQPPTRDLDMDVFLEETRTGRFMFGVGVNSDAGLMGNIVIDERNFDITRFPRSWEEIRNATAWRGAGQRLRLEAVPGTEVQRYMATFQEPYLLNTELSLSLSGFYYDRFYREWDEQRIGGRVALGYHFTKDLSGSLTFRGAEITLSDPIEPTPPDIADALGDNTLLGFGATIARDTRDSSFLATEGGLIELGVEQVVGTYSYPRIDVELRRYFMLYQRPDGSGRHVISLKSNFGWTGDDTPVYDHYFAGGYSTLRGFDFRGVAPIDPGTGVRVGGEFQLLASAEYMFPITADDMVRGVVFCDTGTVQSRIDDWEDKYRIAPGFGLRITIPAMGPAPIALDFAFPIVAEAADDEEMFSFFIGFNH